VVTAVIADDDAAAKKSSPKKGHATPKRAEAQAARRKPIVTSAGTNKPLSKEQKVEQKQKERQHRDEAYEGMKAGVEKHLPARDKGAQRRYVRQYVDARMNLAEYFMPFVFVFLIATMLIQSAGLAALSLILMMLFYVLMIIAAVDLFLMWRKLKSQLIAKFGEVERGTTYYAIMRALQIRRIRLPAPAVSRGNFPK